MSSSLLSITKTLPAITYQMHVRSFPFHDTPLGYIYHRKQQCYVATNTTLYLSLTKKPITSQGKNIPRQIPDTPPGTLSSSAWRRSQPSYGALSAPSQSTEFSLPNHGDTLFCPSSLSGKSTGIFYTMPPVTWKGLCIRVLKSCISGGISWL